MYSTVNHRHSIEHSFNSLSPFSLGKTLLVEPQPWGHLPAPSPGTWLEKHRPSGWFQSAVVSASRRGSLNAACKSRSIPWSTQLSPSSPSMSRLPSDLLHLPQLQSQLKARLPTSRRQSRPSEANVTLQRRGSPRPPGYHKPPTFPRAAPLVRPSPPPANESPKLGHSSKIQTNLPHPHLCFSLLQPNTLEEPRVYVRTPLPPFFLNSHPRPSPPRLQGPLLPRSLRLAVLR